MNPNAPSVKEKVRNIISAVDLQTYFSAMTKSMVQNPPMLPQDSPILKDMARIGIVPGKPFDMSKLSAADQAALADVVKVANEKIADVLAEADPTAVDSRRHMVAAACEDGPLTRGRENGECRWDGCWRSCRAVISCRSIPTRQSVCGHGRVIPCDDASFPTAWGHLFRRQLDHQRPLVRFHDGLRRQALA
ncbi:hypothetical protein [Paraburkholderia fungorum]|uniref:hypothetical protein n=1 Tax=Paraburkholderia fungorum TaxID=134537 RepID=UPI0038BD5008